MKKEFQYANMKIHLILQYLTYVHIKSGNVYTDPYSFLCIQIILENEAFLSQYITILCLFYSKTVSKHTFSFFPHYKHFYTSIQVIRKHIGNGTHTFFVDNR
jgi:hypothetical protein